MSALFKANGYDYGEVTVVCRGPNALRVQDDAFNSFWVPHSQHHPDSEVRASARGMLIVTEWFAWKRKWIGADGYNRRLAN